MLKLLYALLVGLFGAGIVHIAILFLVPDFSERDVWSRLAMVSDYYRVVPARPRRRGCADRAPRRSPDPGRGVPI